MKKQKFIYPVFILFLISTIVFIGCQQEESFEELKVKEVYLSLPPNVNFDQLAEGDFEIISQAFSRLDLKENEDGLFEIIQNSGKDINISSEIFNYFQIVAESSNKKILSDISFSRNRVQTRSAEVGNSSTDCVARSIAYATGQDYKAVNDSLVKVYGSNGVPSYKFYDAVNRFNNGVQIPLSDFNKMEIKSNGKEYIIVINASHAVNLEFKSGPNMMYYDAQNGTRNFCTLPNVTHIYQIR